MSSDKYNISAFELDQLKEMVNIGASHSGDVFSKMIGRKVVLTVPDVNIEDINSAIKYFNVDNESVTAVTADISGDWGGILLFLFPAKSGQKVAQLVSHEMDASSEFMGLDKSVLCEIGNILAGSYLTALSNFLKISILHTVSKIITKPIDQIFQGIILEIGIASGATLVFRVNLAIDGESTETELYLLADPKFTAKILERTKQLFSL